MLTHMTISLPPHVEQALAIDALDPKCPACSMGKYADSGKRYVRCAIERQHFAIEAFPTAVLSYCANEDGYHQCPTWVAMKENDPVVKRQHDAQDAAHMRKAEKGLRTTGIDDLLDEFDAEQAEERKKNIERGLNS